MKPGFEQDSLSGTGSLLLCQSHPCAGVALFACIYWSWEEPCVWTGRDRSKYFVLNSGKRRLM